MYSKGPQLLLGKLRPFYSVRNALGGNRRWPVVFNERMDKTPNSLGHKRR
jgi:hypothetical protein